MVRRLLFDMLRRLHSRLTGKNLTRIRPFGAMYRFVFALLRPKLVRVHGHWMTLDDRDTLKLSYHGTHEPLVTQVLMDNLRPGHRVVDVGANIGYFTLIAARCVGTSGRVFAFEPDPTNFALLQRNVTLNGYSNVTPIQKAVADRAGRGELFLDDLNRGDHQLFDASEGRRAIDVDVIALDDFFRLGEERIDCVKMDIEGAEGLALTGMVRLLHENASVVLVTEFYPLLLHRGGLSAAQYLEDLAAAGFDRMYDVNDARHSVARATPQQLLTAYRPAEYCYTNIVCLKKGSKWQIPEVGSEILDPSC